MLRSPESIRKKRAKILDECEAANLSDEETGRRLIEADPDSAAGYLALGLGRLNAEDLDAAESLLWKSLERAPCNQIPYLALVDLHRRTNPKDVLASGLGILGTWKISFADEVPDDVAEALRARIPSVGDTAYESETFAFLAEQMEAEFGRHRWPDRLLPYRLLNDVQRQVDEGLDQDLVHEILANAEVCVPLFRRALHEWADTDPPALADDAAGLLMALLGEMAGPELVEDLLEVVDDPYWTVLRHAQWAIWRIGQRFPAETFTRLTKAGRIRSSGIRSAIAEQIYLLPEMPGKRQAMLELLEGFSAFAKEGDASYLLLAVSTLLAMLGAPGESVAVLQRHDRQLTKEGRRWISGELDSEEAFVPNLIADGMPELDIEAVCVAGALMIDEIDEDAEFDENGEFDDDEEFIEPVIVAPKPGRNDPCWCGSGKKYKKCHLAADEEAERSGGSSGPPAST